MYWHQKEDIEISERKALDLLQSYWHQLLLRSHMAEINLFLSPFPVTKTCQERSKERGRNGIRYLNEIRDMVELDMDINTKYPSSGGVFGMPNNGCDPHHSLRG
ncbi:hypothetical protein P9199_12550 [Geobacillus stearothermophilus]|uniref:hypothetical protein n=1 Tax=Geobacillus stearothermophilus TaxID=1422 RepID=UPI002E1E1941|nr:hypothetical protein [Geobacillus stearothermophilus]